MLIKNYKLPLLFLLTIFFFRFVAIGAYPLSEPTEGRYAEISREMLVTGDWITPRLHGIPFWGKPPLSFWLGAVSLKYIGINEFGARLPSFLFCIGTIILTWLTAYKLYGKLLGIFSVVILSSSGLFYALSGLVITDTALLFTVTFTICSFFLFSKSNNYRFLFGLLVFLGLALSMLSKGLIGIIFSGIPIATFLILSKEGKTLWSSLPKILGTFLFLAIAVPWHILAEYATPGFLDYYIVGEHFKRFFVQGWTGNLYGSSHKHFLGTIWLFAGASYLPWILIFIPAALWLSKHKKLFHFLGPVEYSLLIWFLSPILFFTLAKNILITYVLPGMPGFSILVARLLYAVRECSSKKISPWYVRSPTLLFSSCLVPASFVIISYMFLPEIIGARSQKDLVAAFFNEDSTRPKELIYSSGIPYTAMFYSNGTALSLQLDTTLDMNYELIDSDIEYFALKKNGTESLSDQTMKKSVEIGDFGRFVLRKEHVIPE